MIYEVCTNPMSLLQAYLQNPRTRRVLNQKPGEKGFSLIELVVVVAVLAILAAIAVPAFMGMQEKAANAAAQTNLKNAYKECAYKTAMNDPNLTFTALTDDAYFEYTDASGNTFTNCKATNGNNMSMRATTKSAHSSGSGKYISIDLMTGAKTSSSPLPAGITSW